MPGRVASRRVREASTYQAVRRKYQGRIAASRRRAGGMQG